MSIPIWKWKTCEKDIHKIKKKFQLEKAEIHTGWIMRPYLEQSKISNFESLSITDRRAAVDKYRRAELLRLRKEKKTKQLNQTRKNYNKTNSYVHLTFEERKKFVHEVAIKIGSWGFARLFAECIDKIYFDPNLASHTIDEQAFEQVVSRFEQYLQRINSTEGCEAKFYGLLIHDNNQTIEGKHTELMKKFHKVGTLWTKITYIIETPLFVNSELTSMIQLTDVCVYAIRRYLEKGEEDLFDEIIKRADRRGSNVVGLRHYTDTCQCKICKNH